MGAPNTAARLSVAHQDYPALKVLVASGEADEPAWTRAIGPISDGLVLMLPPGAMLAPGALASAALAAVLEGADAVAGLRVLIGGGVDVIDQAPGQITAWPYPLPMPDVLIARAAIGPDLHANPRQLAVIGRPVAIVGRGSGEANSTSRLRVAALNDGGGGGAGIAHRRLIDALRLADHTVDIHTLTPRPSPATAEWDHAFPAVESRIAIGSYDLLLAGNIHGSTRDASVLARLHQAVPVAAVTHDMFLLTGRCDIPLDCKLIFDRCTSDCPTPTHYPYLAPARIEPAWKAKRAFLTEDKPAPLLLANSDWSADYARQVLGPAFTGRVGQIALPFPVQVFRPQPKTALRRRLGLPLDDVLVMFASVVSDTPQKGFGDIRAALASVAGPGVGFVVIGRVDDPAALDLPNLFTPGPIAEEQVLADWFAACDLHVTASRFETFGQTPVEAGLCGTPTVAYRRTGLSTAVIDGVSGRLVDPDVHAFAAAVRALVADVDARQALGSWGRLALEARNSHAAGYLTMLRALRAHKLAPPAARGGRIRFNAAMLNAFSLATEPLPGARGTVAPPPGRITRISRRAKHSVWGRTMPLWMRRAAYAVRSVRATVRR